MRELRVLLAEHRQLAAANLRAKIERLGHRVVGVAKDGREAVTSAMTLEPDLIIADLGLPILDGIEMARTILAHKPIPIVLVTAYLAADLVRRAQKAGIVAFLVEPAHEMQLRSSIEVALAHFGEYQLIWSGVKDASETRKALEVLMRTLNLALPEAFQRLQQYSRSEGRSLKEVASAILQVHELFFGRVNVARRLQAILGATRRGLREAGLPTKAAHDPKGSRLPPR